MIPPSAFSDDINDEDFPCSVKDPDEPNIENSKDIGRKSSLKPKETVDDPKIKRKVRKNGTHKISSRNRYPKDFIYASEGVRSKFSLLGFFEFTQQKNSSNCMMI